MAFSGDPVSVIKPLIEVIDGIETEVNKAKIQIASKMETIGTDSDSGDEQARYSEEVKSIHSCRETLERVVNV